MHDWLRAARMPEEGARGLGERLDDTIAALPAAIIGRLTNWMLSTRCHPAVNRVADAEAIATRTLAHAWPCALNLRFCHGV